MRPKCLLAGYLALCAFAVVVIVVCSFAGPSAEAQSSQQPPFPAQSQRPDQAKPLEDKSVQSAPQQKESPHQPTAAELDGQKPPEACDKGGPSPAKTKKELLIYLRDSFAAIRKSVGALDTKNMFDPIEGPYAGPNTRLGLASVIIWHNADHYGQMLLYLRLNGIVPPASRPNPPELREQY
jgi:hypothetical protein